MIKYNFERIFRARGIERPFTFLKRAGFGDNLATRIKNNKVSRLNNSTIEHLCIALKCTPNEFFEWIPDRDYQVEKGHPLNILKKSDNDVDLTRTINSVPIGMLPEIEAMIKEKVNSTTKY